MNDGEWLISVGTGANQELLIKQARATGHRVLGLDRNPNREITDAAITVSTHDTEAAAEAALAWARQEGFRPVGVIARTSGPAVATAQKLAEVFELPNCGAPIAEAAVSKTALASLLEDLRLPGPPTKRIAAGSPFPEGRPLPLVVKPDEPLVGKESVFLVNEKDDWEEAIKDAAAASANKMAALQALLPGREFGLVVLVSYGHIVWHGFYQENVRLSGNKVDPNSTVSALDPSISEKTQDAALASAETITRGGLSSGILFFSFRLDNKGIPNLFEINPGLCGDDLVDGLFKDLWPQINFYDADIALAVGLPLQLSPRSTKRNLLPRAMVQIGGSVLQANTIAFAQANGLAVLLTDSVADPACRHGVEAFAQINGTDKNALAAQALKWAEQYDIVAVHCGADFGLKAAAAASRVLGLPAPTDNAIDAALDKSRSEAAFAAAGLFVPERLSEANATKSLPVIVKPANSSGSRGVSFVEKTEDLAPALAHARKFSEEVIIEDWIDGIHIDANAILVGGTLHSCELFERSFSPFPDCFPIAMQTPPNTAHGIDRELVFEAVHKAAAALSIADGPVKADLIVARDRIYVLEIAPRFHGETNTSAAPLAYGTCSIEQYLKMRAGSPVETEHAFTNAGAVGGWRGIFAPTPGKIAAIVGIENAQAAPGIAKIVLRRQIGDRIKSARDNTAVIGFIYGSGTSSEDLKNKLADAHAAVRITMEPNSD